MDKSKIVIDYNDAWKCDNMDNLADIVWEGYEILFADGTRKLVDDLDSREYRFATEDELKDFYRTEGHLFIGDEVEIIKGRKIPIGEHKFIESFYTYVVPGTHGKVSYEYVKFKDGTYTTIDNVKSIKSDKQAVKHFQFKLGGRK